MNAIVRDAFAEVREEATALREQWGAEEQAKGAEVAVAIIERRVMEAELERLSLEDASAESGYCADHLGRLVRDGTIPNAGEPYSPRIRRCDLPRKPGFNAGDVDNETIRVGFKEQIARSIAESNTGESDG
jgi:hypothetical protein